jgi:hypothetical protein|tara:strand:- start:621 stop:848 length:228 start_codon:yes stop_codon:yes gene_type:complete
MANLITTKEQETAHLRSKSKFYVAGWVANRESENPQKLPKACKGDKTVEEWHKEYLTGYGDSLANGECLAEHYCA